jgi:stage II sporulation protein D
MVSVLLACSLPLSFAGFAQQRPSEETRPRRAQTESKSTELTKVAPKVEVPEPVPGAWKIRPPSIVDADALAGPRIEGEPTIRVALATDIRSASISSNAHLMSATDLAQTFVPLDVTRVRVDSHLLSPLPQAKEEETFRLKIDGLPSRAAADDQAKEIRDSTSEESQPVFDAQTKTWGLLVGPRRSREAAESTQARLEAAGFDANILDLSPDRATSNDAPARPALSSSSPPGSPTPLPSPMTAGQTAALKSSYPGSTSTSRATTSSGVRLASRSSQPTRELITSGPNTGRLFSSSAPVTFASDNEALAPVRFNDKPYRGHIEVFANTRGLLTVVNVLGLEDYVRGVIANELSPGGYPAIEALKAQAIAARTYALRNRGQYASQGYDLLPTTRSQVYRGLTSEQPLSTRAVDETRGLIATYNGEPINALYTSTCGGRTENAENIFNEAIPYLRARECSVEGRSAGSAFTIKTSRESAELREEKNLPLAREVALLAVLNFSPLPSRVSDSWLQAGVSTGETQGWLAAAARLTHQTTPLTTADINHAPAFATALSQAVFGESRADTLLNNADVEYFLAIRDATEVPMNNRADVALLVRDGHLSLFPDLTLRSREPMSRGRMLHAIAHLLESRGLLQVQKGTARPSSEGTLILRTAKGKDQPLRVSPDLYLFRQIGDVVYSVRNVAVVGGEPVLLHLNASGVVDYLEVRAAPNGASAERFSPFTNWTSELSLGQVQARLSRAASAAGPIQDLRVAARGSSRRVTDLEIIGANGLAHVRGGRIRSALGLREQLFVIDRRYDSEGRVTGFVFTGRGWGHGVGMCQVGAYGLARQGLSYEQILKAYYTGIELTRLY